MRLRITKSAHVYSRIIYPGSKKNTTEQSARFIEAPDFELHQVYRL